MKTFSGLRVLVLGGTGFIGSHLVRCLAAAGADLHLLVRKNSAANLSLPGSGSMHRHVGDYQDLESVQSCVKEARPQIVYNLVKDRRQRSDYNEARSSLQLAACLQRSAKDLIRMIRTAHSDQGGYDRKTDVYLADRICASVGVPVLTLELYKVYGPGQRACDFPASVISASLAGKKVKFPKDSGVQDYIYVEDVVNAYRLAGLHENEGSTRLQIGSGRSVSSTEVKRALAKQLHLSDCDIDQDGSNAPQNLTGHPADPSVARKILGWKPRTILQDGFEKTVSYYLKQSGIEKSDKT